MSVSATSRIVLIARTGCGGEGEEVFWRSGIVNKAPVVHASIFHHILLVHRGSLQQRIRSSKDKGGSMRARADRSCRQPGWKYTSKANSEVKKRPKKHQPLISGGGGRREEKKEQKRSEEQHREPSYWNLNNNYSV